MNKGIIALAAVALISGCGQEEAKKAAKLQEQVGQLQTQVKALQAELDEERNGAPRLLATGKQLLADGDIQKAKDTFSALLKRHPESTEASSAKTLLDQADQRLAAIEKQKKMDAERKASEEREALAKLDKNLSKSTDEVREIVWISHKSEPTLGNKMALYFGTKDSSAASYPLRLKFQYYGDDWLFVKKVIIKADGKTFEISGHDFERDHGSGSVWEWLDQPLSDFAMLDTVMSANRVIVRFDGDQYYKDFILPASQKQAMKDILLAWKRYGGKRS